MAKIHPAWRWSMFLLAGACAPGEESSPANEAPAAGMGSYTIEEKTGACDTEGGACLSIELRWEQVVSGLDSTAMVETNKTIAQTMAALFAPDGAAPTTPELSARAMQESFKEYLSAMDDNQHSWEWSAKGSTYLNEKGLLGYEVESYSFTGGAHGIGTQTYLLFSTFSGKLLSLDDFIEPESRTSLEKEGELFFRKSLELQEGADLEASGFWFPENQFYLPENFKLEKEGVRFRFEVYEVGPYALGGLEFTMPWKAVKPFLRADYQSVPHIEE